MGINIEIRADLTGSIEQRGEQTIAHAGSVNDKKIDTKIFLLDEMVRDRAQSRQGDLVTYVNLKKSGPEVFIVSRSSYVFGGGRSTSKVICQLSSDDAAGINTVGKYFDRLFFSDVLFKNVIDMYLKSRSAVGYNWELLSSVHPRRLAGIPLETELCRRGSYVIYWSSSVEDICDIATKVMASQKPFDVHLVLSSEPVESFPISRSHTFSEYVPDDRARASGFGKGQRKFLSKHLDDDYLGGGITDESTETDAVVEMNNDEIDIDELERLTSIYERLSSSGFFEGKGVFGGARNRNDEEKAEIERLISDALRRKR